METERLKEIVTKARRGDDNAMTDLYLDAYRSVYYLALRMVKNPEDAEDITQEVFITVREKITELREPAAFYAWVNQITANKCNRLLSKYKSIARLDDKEEFITLADDNPLNLPDKAIDDEETRRIILEVIDGLPDNQRVCVLLFYYAQFTVTQIANTLETNENTVKSRLALARAKIRAALEEKEKKEGIKLYGIPLALTPILRQAMEQFVMPDGAEARMWENIQKAASKSTPANGGSDKPGTGGAAGQAATSAGMTLATKIIIGLIAAAVVAAGAFIIPKLLESPPEETPPAITDAVTTAPDDTESRKIETEPVGEEHTTDEPGLLETVKIDFVKDVPYNADLDGDGIEDTVIVERGGTTETLLINSSRYGEYSSLFDYTFPFDDVSLIAIDTGNHNYSICVFMPTGGTGAKNVDGLILYGTDGGWERINSLLSLNYIFSGEILDNQTFIVEGETGYSEQLETTNTYVEKGAKVSTDNRISYVSFVLNEETGRYDFVFGQYLYSEFFPNGIGYGYTQVTIDPETKTLIPVKQWVEPF